MWEGSHLNGHGCNVLYFSVLFLVALSICSASEETHAPWVPLKRAGALAKISSVSSVSQNFATLVARKADLFKIWIQSVVLLPAHVYETSQKVVKRAKGLCDIWHVGQAQHGVLIHGVWHIRQISWVQNAQLSIVLTLPRLLFQPLLVHHQHFFQQLHK